MAWNNVVAPSTTWVGVHGLARRNILLAEDGRPILTEDGQYILVDGYTGEWTDIASPSTTWNHVT